MYVELEIFSEDIYIKPSTSSNSNLIEFFLNNFIKLNWKGNWSTGQYIVNDAVRYNQAVWVAINTTTETPSQNSEDWGLMIVDGSDGVGVTNIELIDTIGLTDQYRIYFSDESHLDYYVKNGAKGDIGIGISNISESIPVSRSHLITITLTNGTEYGFTILDGKDGENGQNPEFRVNATHIQWKLINEDTWINLIALSYLVGQTGKNIELGKNSTHLLWRVVGDSDWSDLISLSLITGPAGKSAYQQAIEGGYIGTESEFIAFLNRSYSLSNHNHNLNDLTEKNYNNLSNKPDLSSLHTHTNKTDLDNYNPSNFSQANHNHDLIYEAKNSNIQNHISSTNNPHSVTKSQVGLGNVDNTSDANKPLSNAEVNALGGKVDKETGKGLSQENFTTDEKSKLASLEPSLWLGEYTSLTSLQTAHPTGISGNSAYVDEGEGFPVATYAWDTSDQAWVKQQGTTTVETPESIKQKYESNPDTNAFTNDYKTKLNGISSGADVTKDALNNSTTDNVIEDSNSFNFIKLIEGVPTLVKSTFTYLKSTLKTYFDNLYSSVNHNHNLNDLTEKNYSSLSNKPDLSSLHTHTNKTDLDNYNPSNFEPAKGTDDNYVTDDEKTKLANLSGINTGDQDLSGLQIKNLKFSNQEANTANWVADTTYSNYGYKCDLSITGVASTDIAEVVFGHTEAISGNYSPVCLTATNKVTIYSKVNTTITIPTILINKQS